MNLGTELKSYAFTVSTLETQPSPEPLPPSFGFSFHPFTHSVESTDTAGLGDVHKDSNQAKDEAQARFFSFFYQLH